MTVTETPSNETRSLDFIREIVEEDLRTGKHSTVVTRFPPEPNGYLHIGHAKSICLNFGVAANTAGAAIFASTTRTRTKEEAEYARAIVEDVQWLGFGFGGGEPLHASDYFEQLYDWAKFLIAQRARLRRQPRAPTRCANIAARSPSRGRIRRTATAASRRTSISSGGCARASSRTARTCCGRRSTWRRRTSTCAIRCSIASATRSITAPATRGASTRCTTTRIRCRTRSKGSRTRSARWSSKTIGRCTTGSSRPCPCRRVRGSTSSRGSTSTTR